MHGVAPGSTFQVELDWIPTAKKNRHRITYFGRPCPVCGRAKPGIRPSAQSEGDQEALRMVATAIRGRRPPIPEGHAVSFRLAYLVGAGPAQDRVDIVVSDLGPDDTPAHGRRRDLDNLVQVITDAFQGVLFTNDRQVAELVLRRVPKP